VSRRCNQHTYPSYRNLVRFFAGSLLRLHHAQTTSDPLTGNCSPYVGSLTQLNPGVDAQSAGVLRTPCCFEGGTDDSYCSAFRSFSCGICRIALPPLLKITIARAVFSCKQALTQTQGPAFPVRQYNSWAASPVGSSANYSLFELRTACRTVLHILVHFCLFFSHTENQEGPACKMLIRRDLHFSQNYCCFPK